MTVLVQISYLIATILFIFSLKEMSHPRTARRGIIWGGVGMALATVATLFWPDMSNYVLMLIALIVGGAIAWWSAKKVEMTDMPQMVALYNGMGGGAAAAIAAVALAGGHATTPVLLALALLGALIGSVAFSGSIMAFMKLQGWQRGAIRFPGQQALNIALFAATVLIGVILFATGAPGWLTFLFFLLALAVGVSVTVPIGGADMPVVISLYNALTGLAVAFEGFAIDNTAMIVAGTIVGAAGTMLTQLMAKAMNRPLANVLFGSFGVVEEGAEAAGGSMKPIEEEDAGVMMGYASRVIIVPGYGMAVAQAQHKIWELTQALQKNGVDVKFAIHPVAGRMPGHMNVLLAEPGVPYDLIYDMEDINSEFAAADVALVIGANDVVNPAARNNPSSPIYGMPILDVDKAKNVLVIKRGKGAGFSGIENDLFVGDNTRMLFGDAKEVVTRLVQTVKEV